MDLALLFIVFLLLYIGSLFLFCVCISVLLRFFVVVGGVVFFFVMAAALRIRLVLGYDGGSGGSVWFFLGSVDL